MSRLCPACRRRAYVAYQCSRITEATVALRVPVDHFEVQLEEVIAIQAEAAENHPAREDQIN